MKKIVVSTLGLLIAAAPLLADGHVSGDAEAGASVFKKCKSCHMIVADDGEVITKGGKTGPNLYGIYMRNAGSSDGFKYGKSIVEAGEKGLVWDDESKFAEYAADPRNFLRDYLDDKKAKSKMSYKLKSSDDAADVWAYLVSVGPDVSPEAQEDAQSN